MNSTLSDEDLMGLVQKGDSQALGILYERHAERVWSYIIKRLPKESAEDVFQDCFVKLVEKRTSWNGQPFILWLFVVLRNLVIDFHRSRKIEDKVFERLSKIEEDEVQADFNELISTMPSETAKLLKEFFKEGLSYKELAAKYESSEMTIRKRMSRAIAILRKGE